MLPNWEQLLLRLLLFALFLSADAAAVHFDLGGMSVLSAHDSRGGHQSQQRGPGGLGMNFYSPQMTDHRVTNITTQIGTHAYLPCKERQLANKAVSWIRVRDDNILAVDRLTFIADDRFQAFFVDSTGMWTLQIKYVQARDAGLYECQVSTEPKVSARVHLHVVVPRTELIGEPNRYVKAGSRVVIRCVIRGALEPPSYVMWYFGADQIFPDNKFGWDMRMDEGDSHSTIASLILPAAKKQDSGNYTCYPSNSDAITVMLHVINGEYSVSAVTSSAPSQYTIRNNSFIAVVLLFLAVVAT